jgi:hypothetical protein
MMSHPDPLYDPDNSEDDDMNYDDHDDFYQEVEDYNDYYIEENNVDDDDYDDSMDGDHDSAMRDAGFGTDEDYGYYGEDF